MALATQCPHCHTAFKVAYDQLKLRAGLVRCGTCKEVFNGIENLVRPDALTSGLSSIAPAEMAPAAPLAPEPLKPASVAEKSTGLPPLDLTVEKETSPISFAPPAAQVAPQIPALAPAAPATPAASGKTADPLHYTSLADFTVPQKSEPIAPAATAAKMPPEAPPPAAPSSAGLPLAAIPEPTPESIAEPESRPAPPQAAAPIKAESLLPPQPAASTPAAPTEDESLPEPEAADFSLAEDEAGTHEEEQADAAEAAEDEVAEPDFVLRSRRRQRIGRILRLIMGIGSALLFIGAALQGAYAFRNQLAAWFPQTKPVLAQLCQVAGCQVKLPAQIDMVTIESNELQALAADKNIFLLTLLLRNHSAVPQAWPSIELTLNDADETALARRVLQPRDYLPPGQDVARGFAANSEQPLKLTFELAQLKASGYRVYLFYP